MLENRKYRFSRDGAHEIETRYDISYTTIEQHSWLPKWPFCSGHLLAHHIKKSDVFTWDRSNRKAMNRNWSNQKANPALKTKAGNK